MLTGIKCAREACDIPNACFRHSQNGNLYCPKCARLINEAAGSQPTEDGRLIPWIIPPELEQELKRCPSQSKPLRKTEL